MPERRDSGLSPEAPPFFAPPPTQPSTSGETDLLSNRYGRKLAPGLSIGHHALTPDQMHRRIRGSTRTAAVTIIDGTLANPHQWRQDQAVQRIMPNFLSVRLRPDASGTNISLLLKLRDICNFIDSHFATVAEQLQMAARGFDEDDDDMFMGPALLGRPGREAAQPFAEQSQFYREVIIHGGRTHRTQGQPTFVALAYLMRKQRIGLSEAITRALAYDGRFTRGVLFLTTNQRAQLEVWHECDYDLFEHLGDRDLVKGPYREYLGGLRGSRFGPPGSGRPSSTPG